jgi:hypothetical protein
MVYMFTKDEVCLLGLGFSMSCSKPYFGWGFRVFGWALNLEKVCTLAQNAVGAGFRRRRERFLLCCNLERVGDERRKGRSGMGSAHMSALLRNSYNGPRAGGWSFTASNTHHVGGQQERRRRFSVSSGEDSGRREMEGVPSKRREPYGKVCF